jgi:hypothetical protein
LNHEWIGTHTREGTVGTVEVCARRTRDRHDGQRAHRQRDGWRCAEPTGHPS